MARKRTSEPEIAVTQGSAAGPIRRKGAAPYKKHTPAASVVEPVAEPTAEPIAESFSAAEIPSHKPAHEEIAALAYSYWVARGCQGGSPEQDWLKAEAELRRAAQPVTA